MSFTLAKITATQLSTMALDNFCPRCFWMKARVGFKTPYSIFPKIFNDIDSVSKQVTELYQRATGKLPSWLPYEFKEFVPTPEYGKFSTIVQNILLSGQPDHVIRRPDNKLIILDYKTTRLGQGGLIEMYKMQVNIYRVIAKEFGLGETAEMALVYYEPLTELADIGDAMVDPQMRGFMMKFRPTLIKVGVEDIDALILRAKLLLEGPMPAALRDRAGQTCRDCEALRTLAGILGTEMRVPLAVAPSEQDEEIHWH